VNPEPIFDLLLAYRVAAALRTAIELDYFSALAEGQVTAPRIAKSRGGTERSVRILLDALAATAPEVLKKSGSRYRLTPLSRRYLVGSSPEFVGAFIPLLSHKTMWDGFRDLPLAVRLGTSVLEKNAHAKDQTFWEDFARSTRAEAIPKAMAMLRMLKWVPPGCEVLDLACGSGGYGGTFARCIPGAKVTLLDQPNVLAVTRTLVEGPVQFLEGDLFETPYGGPYDLVIASHVFHHFDPQQCELLASKMAGALKPGGRLVIQEFVADEKRTSRPQALLFALTMLVWTRSGDAYAYSDYRRWLRRAGLRKLVHRPLLPPADLILGTR
jgi:ubiquinone/menaquinone biosynthesis C-methylase UbiE